MGSGALTMSLLRAVGDRGSLLSVERREEFARDVVLLKYVGLNPIVVHGGGPEITGYMERLGMPVEFVGGLRVSGEETV